MAIASSEKPRILVVDDEARIRRLERMNLELEGFEVIEAADGFQALDRVREDLPNLVVMDVAMPQMDGFETLHLLREISSVPVIMVTVKAEVSDRIHGLDLGADDYLTKPFNPQELVSRIRAVLRRTDDRSLATQELIRVDDGLSIDLERHEVLVHGVRIKLRPTEYRLLYHLVQNAGRVVPRETLMARVWGPEYRDEHQLLRVYITYLRQKIEPDPAHPRYIMNERGVGYSFVDFKRRPGE
ncbi:MAG: response regulator transcription factor [Anaerolineae bacterium]|uniref:response regulator transcription factor n=1 Tax=Candidatus Amarolinea dominans TaxID=3140696 RepID=UPI003134C049|nr:response regulator transcription factor [Anaerolineae bacterium]MBK9091855.1 response regulator transcription factor [Anaerolineae bacterium]MBK9232403.1 response regulator transcription factor [Anaerolineae bacterium]